MESKIEVVKNNDPLKFLEDVEILKQLSRSDDEL